MCSVLLCIPSHLSIFVPFVSFCKNSSLRALRASVVKK